MTPESPTIEDSIRVAHVTTSRVERTLQDLHDKLCGYGQTGAADTASKPSGGLVSDAHDLTNRLRVLAELAEAVSGRVKTPEKNIAQFAVAAGGGAGGRLENYG